MFFVFGPLWFVVAATLLFLLLRNLPRRSIVVVVPPPLPTFWIWYSGMTPPLGLHIRPVTSDILNPTIEKYAQQLYGLPTVQLTTEQDDRACCYAMAEQVVIDWSHEGKPYQAATMAELLVSDPNIMPFILCELRARFAEQKRAA